jgi:hypothetical protein
MSYGGDILEIGGVDIKEISSVLVTIFASLFGGNAILQRTGLKTWGFFRKIFKPVVKNDEIKVLLDEFKTEDQHIKSEVLETLHIMQAELHGVKDLAAIFYINQNKQLFYDHDVPLSERLVAGLEYLHAGGNGKVRQDVEDCISFNKDIYETIVLLKPGLRLDGFD